MRLLAIAAGLAVASCSPSAPPAGNAQDAQAGQPPTQAPPGATLAGIPNLTVEYYDVRGRNLFEIRRDLNRLRPRDPNDRLGVDAVSRWYMSWRWPTGADGGCDLAATDLRFSATLRMPRLVDTAGTPEAVLIRWRRYMVALEGHEAGHIRHAWDNRAQVLAAIRASSCAGANDAGQAATAALARWDLDYDRTTRHGFTQGAHFP